MGFQMVIQILNPDDLLWSKVKVKPKIFEVEYLENGIR